MERKIIFKAWDSQLKVMIDGFAIYAEGDHLGISDYDAGEFYSREDIEKYDGSHFGQGDDWIFILNNFQLLQFTGLIDKNGKEIFEGDIIAIPEFYETPEMTGTRYVNWEVVFLHGAWHLQRPAQVPELGETNMYQEHFSYDENFEVLGSVYENPELLTPRTT